MMSLQPYAYYDSRRLRNQQPHARHQPLVHRSDQRAEPARGAGLVHHGHRRAHLQRADVRLRQTASRCWSIRTSSTSGTCYTAPSTAPAPPRRRPALDGNGATPRHGKPGDVRLALPTIRATRRPAATRPPCPNAAIDLRRRDVRLLRRRKRRVRPNTTPSRRSSPATRSPTSGRPNDKLNVNVGVRSTTTVYVGANTNYGAARDFWFNAFNRTRATTRRRCRSWTAARSSAVIWSTNAQTPCSSARQPVRQRQHAERLGPAFDYNVLQPRIGATYTVNPDTVLRASYGSYNEQPQLGVRAVQLAAAEPARRRSRSSIRSASRRPDTRVAPSISYNSDFSIEHHFKGTDMSFKLTPFLRQTQDQVENFYINYTQGFISGLNAGNQTVRGLRVRSSTKATSAATAFAGTAVVRVHLRDGEVQHAAQRHDDPLADQRAASAVQRLHEVLRSGRRAIRQAAVRRSRSAAATIDAAIVGRALLLRRAARPIQPARRRRRRQPVLDVAGFTAARSDAAYLPYSTFPGGRSGRASTRYNYPVRRHADPELQARPALRSRRRCSSKPATATARRSRRRASIRPPAAARWPGSTPAIRAIRTAPPAARPYDADDVHARPRFRFPIRTPGSSTASARSASRRSCSDTCASTTTCRRA